MQSIFSSTVIRPPSIPGPPILLTSGIESRLKDLWSDQSCIIEVVSEVSLTSSKFVCVYTVFTSLLLGKIRLILYTCTCNISWKLYLNALKLTRP